MTTPRPTIEKQRAERDAKRPSDTKRRGEIGVSTTTRRAEYLVDGGFVTLDNIEAISRRGSTAYAPVPKPRNNAVDRTRRNETTRPVVAAWRVRMGTEDAKRIYVQRGVLAERTNADLRVHRGLDRLNVRGLAKVKQSSCSQR